MLCTFQSESVLQITSYLDSLSIYVQHPYSVWHEQYITWPLLNATIIAKCYNLSKFDQKYISVTTSEKLEDGILCILYPHKLPQGEEFDCLWNNKLYIYIVCDLIKMLNYVPLSLVIKKCSVCCPLMFRNYKNWNKNMTLNNEPWTKYTLFLKYQLCSWW